MERKVPGLVSVSRRICAQAQLIFGVLADPARHPEFDGSGMVRRGGSTALVGKVGDVFSMKMYLPELGDYEMRNIVVEYELNRRIAWEPTPGDEVAAVNSGLAIGTSQGYRWGFELAPDGLDGTIVTESFECSEASAFVREAVTDGERWIASMCESLERLELLCGQLAGVCGLDDLFGPSRQQEGDGAGEALGSWVAVPVSEAAEREPQRSSSPAPFRLPAEVSHATHLAVPVTMEPERLAEIA